MANGSLPIVGGHNEGFGATTRQDRWWIGPVLTFLGLSTFIVYATWAAFQGTNYYHEPYLSPFYSPVLFTDLSAPGAAPLIHSWLGEWPSWWPSFLPASPAFLILAFPGAFRFTCYYYRKAYYRSFTGTPPGCSVSPAKMGSYQGETTFLLFQNLHRYALYFALIFVVILYYDAFAALSKNGQFGIGVGTIVLFIIATLLAGYTFGCHSFRHLIGGRNNVMSCGGEAGPKLSLWRRASWCNERHMKFAWFSLFWVGFSDLYVRLVSMGIIPDLNTWG